MPGPLCGGGGSLGVVTTWVRDPEFGRRVGHGACFASTQGQEFVKPTQAASFSILQSAAKSESNVAESILSESSNSRAKACSMTSVSASRLAVSENVL